MSLSLFRLVLPVVLGLCGHLALPAQDMSLKQAKELREDTRTAETALGEIIIQSSSNPPLLKNATLAKDALGRASGRLDAYIEEVISLWDVAAGILLVETAGGRAPLYVKDKAAEKYSMCCSNGLLPLADVEEEMGG